MKHNFSKRSSFLSRTHLFWTLKTGLSQFGSIFPVHRDQIAAHGGKKLNYFSVKSCGETQRNDHQIPQKLSTCRQTDRFLAVFYNSSLVRNFERPLEDHCVSSVTPTVITPNVVWIHFWTHFWSEKLQKLVLRQTLNVLCQKSRQKCLETGRRSFFLCWEHTLTLSHFGDSC